MDSSDRSTAFIWFFVMTAVVLCCFFTSSCVQRDNELEQQVKVACIRAGGTYGPAVGTGQTYVCHRR